MATIYPNGIDGLTQLPRVVDSVSPIVADDVNRIRDAVVAVEKELGVDPSATYGNVRDRLDAMDSLIDLLPEVSDGYGMSIMLDYLSVSLELPTEKTYNLLTNIPYDGYVFSVASLCNAGTATAEILIDGTALGGGPNAVSTTQDIVYHAGDREFVVGNDIQLTISSLAAATDVVVTVVYIRFIEAAVTGGGPGAGNYIESTSVPSVDNTLARYDGATGLLIEDSAVILNDFGVMSDVTGLGVNLSTPTSTFHVDGSIALGVTTISSGPVSLTSGYGYVLADAASGAFNIFLPEANTCTGRVYNIKKVDSTANIITIIRSGSDLIDGGTSFQLTIEYESLTFANDGSNWYIF